MPDFSSAALSSIDVATATPHSSALHMKQSFCVNVSETYYSVYWKGNLDLLNIVMIGLAEELPEHDEMYELHRLLGALFSQVLTQEERLELLDKEYNIPIEDSIRKDVSVMCNLSQGIKEAGIAEGMEKGIAEGMEKGKAEVVLNMHNNGFTLEQIVVATGMTIEEIKAVIAE